MMLVEQFDHVAHSAAFKRTLDAIRTFALYEKVLVLLEGEAGTGKTSLARYLHLCSPRRERAFHRVDLGAIEDALAGSELFGHVPGAFTGAQMRRHGHFASADRGTLFLDEIGKASATVQRKLLHVIESSELIPVGADRPVNVDVRLVAATNASLEDLVARGDFLPDLLPRFGFFRVVVPALRERRADIGPLARAIVGTQAAAFGYHPAAVPELDEDLLLALESAPWPGNVRELVAAIQFLLVAGAGAPILTLLHCHGPLLHLTGQYSTGERIRQAVAAERSVTKAARKLGVARTTVYRHMRQEPATPPGLPA